MRLINTLLFFLISISITAQKLGPYAISSMGQSYETESVTLYVSIGEPINTVIEDGTLRVSQGILQVLFNEAELANPPCAANTTGTLFFENCDDGNLYFFVRTADGTIYDPYYLDGVSFEHTEGEIAVNFGFFDADFETPCSIAEKAIIITCIESATTTNTEDLLSKTAGFKVLPNPSQQSIQIASNDKVPQSYDLQLFDLQGKLVLQKWNVQHQEEVDISLLPSGMYYLSLSNELQQRKTIKLVKK